MYSQQNDAADVRVFPPAVPLLTILVGVGLGRLWPVDPGFDIPSPARYWVGGLIVAALFSASAFGRLCSSAEQGKTKIPGSQPPHDC